MDKLDKNGYIELLAAKQEIVELKDKVEYFRKLGQDFKDKLAKERNRNHRRNMQIKDLKKGKGKYNWNCEDWEHWAKSEWNYGNKHLPDWFIDIMEGNV